MEKENVKEINPVILLERVQLHRTEIAYSYVDFWSTGDVVIHEIYNDSNSPFDIDRTGYHVMMAIRGSDARKLRDVLNERYKDE